MNTPDIMSQSHLILWLTFAITFALGAVMQQTSFCTMGAIADVFLMGSWDRLRQWSLAIGVAIIGFTVMATLGVIDPLKSIYTSSKLLLASTLVGSTLFGLGMMLASGCGSKTLVRIGGGNLKSLVVFLALGLSAYMSLKGFLGVIRFNTLDTVFISLATPQDLPSIFSNLTGVARDELHFILGTLIGGAFILFALIRKSFWTFENVLAGIFVGLAICAVWWVSGHLGYLAEDPNTLEEVFLGTNSGKMESLSFVAPYAYTLDWLMFYSDISKVLTIGVVAVIGMILGSAFMAVSNKSFRWESFRDPEDTANHLIGGVLMGFGGVTALGCTIGQGLSGVSTLALGSFIALPGFVFGAYLGLRYLQYRMSPNPCD
ncbi:YeeE/YedE family protein [Polynucleobacter paludilacus]|uniref:YeeE/YedE family protein n=1 Tax=Polynucleobacter paludilacus TaxID=1855895 RepID=UPI001BFE122D|nr:YeeE/YedE family protein [Polynucleobacter paludilacus]QWD87802.1 YeeE/YedE family protein [Polynucleobacter paludilacus]